jgi:predicted nucleic acid-binding protein
MWIASLVVERGLVLYSRDRHFEQLPQLSLL